jgi:hypothetical protein
MDWGIITMNKFFDSLIGNKKGGLVGFSWMFLFWRFVLVCFIAIALVVLVKSYISADINIQETHARLFMDNVLYAKEGISLYDTEIDRVYPAWILVDSFSSGSVVSEILDNRMDYGEEAVIAARLDLLTLQDEELGTAYHNKEWYDRWIVLARTFWKGAGSTTEFSTQKTVLLVYSDGTKEPGVLQFSVVMPNS